MRLRLPHILTTPPDLQGVIRPEGDEAAHLIRVLRAKIGDQFVGFDGRGHGWVAEIVGLHVGVVDARVLESLDEPQAEPAVTMVVGVVKAARMDWAVEKAAELGASRFVPLETERSVVEPGSGKTRRWRGIALAAAKQSRRLHLMEVQEPVRFNEFIPAITAPCFHFDLSPDAVKPTEAFVNLKEIPSLSLLIGPEGGWSEAELAALTSIGSRPVNLGSHTLRTETAVAVGLALAVSMLGRE